MGRTVWYALAAAGFVAIGCGDGDESESGGDVEGEEGAATAELDGRIVFTRAGGRFGDETVFVADADGTDERQLSDLGRACCPWVSRDGSTVLFALPSSDGRLTVATVAIDGSEPVIRPLPDGTINLGPGPFSPDGAEVALEGFDDTDPSAAGIYVGSVDGDGELRRVTRDGGIPGDWSPDGEALLFFRGPGGDPPAPGGLYVVRADGTAERRLTPNDVRVQCCFGFRWSPDGSRALFADTDGVLWTISADGSVLEEVYRDEDARYAITPTWSPDGSRILFGLDPIADPFAHPPNGLYVVDADGGGDPEPVILGDDFKRIPTWVPDP